MKPTRKAQSACTAQAQAQAQGTSVYWGDTHLHTGNSFDVYLFGTTSSTPETAIRFTRGEAVTITTTQQRKMQFSQTLDIVVVSDHAEALGSTSALFAGDKTFTETWTGKRFLELAPDQTPEQLIAAYGLMAQVGSNIDNEYGLTGEDICEDLHGGDRRVGTWNDDIDTVERYNAQGEFTTLLGWEWSSQPQGGNMHRVVFTPDAPEIMQTILPYRSLESMDPEDQWTWLDTTSGNTGARIIAIPTTPHRSMGHMFATTTQSFNRFPSTQPGGWSLCWPSLRAKAAKA